MSSAAYSRHGFAAAAGTTFEVEIDDGGSVVRMVLDRVADGPAVPGVEQYSVYFRGPGEPVLGQRSFSIAHPMMGTMELFLVPVGRVDEQTEYEACFNYPADGG
jgi:hypothetical protein